MCVVVIAVLDESNDDENDKDDNAYECFGPPRSDLQERIQVTYCIKSSSLERCELMHMFDSLGFWITYHDLLSFIMVDMSAAQAMR